MRPVEATLYKESDTSGRLVLDSPQYGIAAGQAAVIYDNNRVLGGGWIKHARNKVLKDAA